MVNKTKKTTRPSRAINLWEPSKFVRFYYFGRTWTWTWPWPTYNRHNHHNLSNESDDMKVSFTCFLFHFQSYFFPPLQTHRILQNSCIIYVYILCMYMYVCIRNSTKYVQKKKEIQHSHTFKELYWWGWKKPYSHNFTWGVNNQDVGLCTALWANPYCLSCFLLQGLLWRNVISVTAALHIIQVKCVSNSLTLSCILGFFCLQGLRCRVKSHCEYFFISYCCVIPDQHTVSNVWIVTFQ